MQCPKCGSLKLTGGGSKGGVRYYACTDCGKSTAEHLLSDTPSDEPTQLNKVINYLKITKGAVTIAQVCKRFDVAPSIVEQAIKSLQISHYNIELEQDKISSTTEIPVGGERIIDYKKFKSKKYKFGITADNHLNSHFERLDILNALYDKFEEEGVTEVYNAGNWIDGEARFNKYQLYNIGIDPQINYMIANYPKRKGISTYYVTGDDHEGWYIQRERINIGDYLEFKAKEAGRDDLVHLGYVEADVILNNKEGEARMKIMHGGGGSAYALSYTPQKMIESFQGGEKPHILILGHYHKAEYMYYRDVHCVQAGCTQDQTIFMRKKKIQAAVGGWIIEFEQSIDGAICNFSPRWFNFFNKEYYKQNNYYR